MYGSRDGRALYTGMIREREESMRIAIATCLAAGVFAACGDDVGDRDFRQDMRDLVQAVSAAGKAARPGFLVVPQNGQELLTANGNPAGVPVAAYLAAIDGTGREDLLYGYTGDDAATPDAERDWMLGFLAVARDAGKRNLVTDYCSTAAKMDDSYAANSGRGDLSYAAQRRELDALPSYPVLPWRAHALDVTNLAVASNFLYVINPAPWGTRAAFVAAMDDTDFDVLIIDLFVEGEPLVPADLAALRTKKNGGTRLVLCYLSIGEAEDYRWYWNPDASWAGDGNPEWPGNYAAKYWDPAWHAVVYGAGDSYLSRVVAAGFDGVYLDKIDEFEYWESR